MATVQNGQTKQLTATRPGIAFYQCTRQNYQMLPKAKGNRRKITSQFTLPKVRLLSSILVEVEATATLTSSSSHSKTPLRTL